MLIDLSECDRLDFTQVRDLWASGHRHFLAFVHRFGEAGTIGEMDGFYSYWVTRKPEGFGEPDLAALRELVPALGLAINRRHKSTSRARSAGSISAATRPSR